MCDVLLHDALIYGSDREFLGTVVPFVREGLEAGEPVCCVTTERNIALLTAELEEDARRVTFIPAGAWYRYPATTIAGYRRMLDEHLCNGASRVRVIGEVRFGDDPTEQREWTRYESIVNAAFSGLPAWVVCPYDTRRLPAEVVQQAAATHPHTIQNGARQASDGYRDPAELCRIVPPSPVPVDGTLVIDREIEADPGDLRRELTAVTDGQIDPDLLLAVNEVVTNALVHGGGWARVRIWCEGTAWTCEVSDRGPGLDDPLSGYVPPQPDTIGGLGLWMTRQLCPRVEIRPGGEGTTVRFWKDGWGG